MNSLVVPLTFFPLGGWFGQWPLRRTGTGLVQGTRRAQASIRLAHPEWEDKLISV